MNQCDGCMTGSPLRDGLHIDDNGHAYMACQAERYGVSMDTQKALNIVSRQAPCPHYSLDTSLGDGKTWARCEDCGATVPQDRIDVSRKSASEFDSAISALRDEIPRLRSDLALAQGQRDASEREVERLRSRFDTSGHELALAQAEAMIEQQAAEIARLRERCSPSEVVMIGDAGHYVSEAVAAEIARLQKHIRSDADAYWDARESLTERIERLRDENAGLRKDAERLDWLTFNISGKALRAIGVEWGEYANARAAIDAAMQKGE